MQSYYVEEHDIHTDAEQCPSSVSNSSTSEVKSTCLEEKIKLMEENKKLLAELNEYKRRSGAGPISSHSGSKTETPTSTESKSQVKAQTSSTAESKSRVKAETPTSTGPKLRAKTETSKPTGSKSQDGGLLTVDGVVLMTKIAKPTVF